MQNFINKDDLKTCLTNYGFGSKTDIELPRELVGNLVFNYPVEIAAASYGQGISTTAIQQLQALSIIANDGYMVKPHIISKIVNNGNTTYERQISKTDRIVSSEAIEYIKKLMYNTVNDVEGHATGIGYRVEGLEVIGKTGTAQIYDSNSGGYLTGYTDYIYSFAGMFPKEDPEIIIFVSIKRPNNGSSSSVKNMVQPVIESIAKYKGLIDGGANDVNSPIKLELSNYINNSIGEVKELLEKKGLDVIVLGDGDKIISQYPKENSEVLSGDKVFLLTNSENILMPDLTNYSRIEAISLFNILNIDYEIEGYGYVYEQSILPNETIKDKIIIKLKNEDIIE